MRELFHTPENYFLSHSVGALPKAAQGALNTHYFEPWKSGENWSLWIPALNQYRKALAAMLGVKAANICPQINISSALTKILHSLALSPKKRTILLSRQDFPTIGFVCEQAVRQGYAVKFIDGHPSEFSNWEAAMDETIAVIHITHALSNSSHLLPAEQLCRLAQQYGTVSIVDVAQSLAAVDINLTDWDPDFVIGTSVKFLCGGPGACFLYAAPHMLEQCKPIDVGWFSHENPFEMDINQFRYAKDAMRFFGGTPSPAPFISASCAIGLWGSQAGRTAPARIQAHLAQLWARIPPQIIVSPHAPEERGATFVIAPERVKTAPDNIRQSLSRILEANQICFDERAEGFRFSVHGYTSAAEVDALAHTVLSGLP